MGKIYLNSIDYTGSGGGGNADIVHLTQAQYDALPSSKLTDNKLYMITDGSSGGGGINYSTSEQDTGLTWIDGSEIYQKSYSGTASSSSNTIEASFTNKKIIEANGYITKSNGMGISIGGLSNSTTWAFGVHIDNSNNLCVIVDNDTINGEYCITIRYIKTSQGGN